MFRSILSSFCLVTILVVQGCTPPKRERVLVPASYRGWVIIRYGVTSAKAAIIEDGFRLISVGPDGQVATSDSQEFGEYFLNEYFFVDEQGLREKIPRELLPGGGFSKDENTSDLKSCRVFWVGTSSDINSQEDIKKHNPNDC